MVRDDFRKKARQSGPYHNVHVSFSHDPCEKTMNLITQIPRGVNGLSRSNSTRSNANGNGVGNGVNGLARRESQRKKIVDKDGWQTVKGKKR
jgi:hypothetical protein